MAFLDLALTVHGSGCRLVGRRGGRTGTRGRGSRCVSVCGLCEIDVRMIGSETTASQCRTHFCSSHATSASNSEHGHGTGQAPSMSRQPRRIRPSSDCATARAHLAHRTQAHTPTRHDHTLCRVWLWGEGHSACDRLRCAPVAFTHTPHSLCMRTPLPDRWPRHTRSYRAHRTTAGRASPSARTTPLACMANRASS